MPTATKAPKAKLTLRDSVDLLAGINQAIEDHIDEIELNEGALPDWMQSMLDEVDAAMADRVDALAFKIDQFTGFAATAKATKDRSARREKVWNNAIKGMKAYGKYQVERNGGQPLKGVTASLRLQANPVAVECALTNEELHEIAWPANGALKHPLADFVLPVCDYTLDKKRLAAAYQARRAVLEEEASLIDESDIDFLENETVDVMRARYVATYLADEFPGVTCVRGHHLRID